MSEPVPSVPPVPFDYTARDYSTIRARLIEQVRGRIPGWTGYTDPSDFGLALIEALSYAADGLHYYLDRIANEAYISSAVRPESVREAARIMGYRPSRASSAQVMLRFFNTTNNNITVYPGTRCQTAVVNDVTSSPIYFETTNPTEGTVVGAQDYADIPATEGVTYKGDDGTGEILGVSNGYGWMSFTLPRAPVLHGYVQVFITYSDNWTVEWTQVEDIRAARANDNVFQVEQFPGQPVRIKFGNGNSGAVPPVGSIIKVVYRVGGGLVGNVDADTITVISDDVSLIGLTVTNDEPAYGGAEEESLASIRSNVRLPTLASSDRASSLSDFERLALTVAGVGKSRAYTSDGVITVAVSPVADGTSRPGLATFVKTATVSNKALTSNVATLTTSAAHGFSVGDVVVVAGVDAVFNGEFTITTTPTTTTFTYAKTNANVTSAAATGTVTRTTQAMSESFGSGSPTSVLGAVQKKLSDSAYSGAYVTSRIPEYIQIFVKATITVPSSLSESSRTEIKERMLKAFSYENMSLGQQITPFQVQRLFASAPGVIDVTLDQFTANPNTALGGWSTLVETVSLADYQVGWIESNDPSLVQFVTS